MQPAYTSSQKLLNESAMDAVILLLLQSRKFWWYLLLTCLLLLHDVTMTSWRHTAPHTCNSWTAASGNAKLCCVQPVASKHPDLSPLDYEIWAVMQHRVYRRQIHSVDELKRRLIDVSLVRSWTVDVWRDYWPVARKTPSERVSIGGHFREQPVNWQCWFCPHLLHSMSVVYLLHL